MLPHSFLGIVIFSASVLVYVVFWLVAMVHAFRTPHATNGQRWLWVMAMGANPATAIWYWYIWKKKAFWTLFTPILGAFISWPVVIKSILTKADETVVANFLYGLGSARLVVLVSVLMVFPLVFKLVALVHLGKNTRVSAMDRNDWIVSLALPVFGFGAAVAYFSRFERRLVGVGLVWWIVILLALKTVAVNIFQAVITVGEEQRIEWLRRIDGTM